MEDYEKSIHINDETFDGMRGDIDLALQRLIKNMIEKGSEDGKLTVSIEVNLTKESIPNYSPNTEEKTRSVYVPIFTHKVGSVMQIKDETKGAKRCDGMELVWDDEKKEYVLKPIADTEQRTIFDDDFRCVNDEDDDDDEHEDEDTPALEGRCVAALPMSDTEEDKSEEFNGMPLPFNETDEDYEYEQPEDNEGE